MLDILIIDDEELIRMGLAKLISEAGRDYNVRGCCPDGKEALLQLSHDAVDVIITDVRMPEMDGLEFLKSLRSMNISIPVIILSGYNDFEYARTAMSFGVRDYLLKPVDEEELFKCLDLIYDDKCKDLQRASNSVKNNEKRVINIVKKIIETEYYKELNLSEISNKVFLNSKYLSRLFKNETGINITDYLIQARMEKAKQLFRENLDMKVYEVAAKVGYPDPGLFCKLFKRMLGLTPKEYRNRIDEESG